MKNSNPILLIGPLPPFTSAASILCLNTAIALSSQGAVLCVIDDLAPNPPVDLPVSFIRYRDLKKDWGNYQNCPRLFIIGGDGDSLFSLELLKKAPAPVLLADFSLYPLIEPACRTAGARPDAYWQWLLKTQPDQAAILYDARLHHRREAPSLGRETPALGFLLKHATQVIAPSPAAATVLQASGIAPALTLPLPLVAAQATDNNQPHSPPANILYISETNMALQATRKHLQAFNQCAALTHTTIHPGARHLGAAVNEADIIILLEGKQHCCSPALALALQSGKLIITSGQRWVTHLPETCHLNIPHSSAFEALAVAIGGLLTQSELCTAIREAVVCFWQQTQKSSPAEQLVALAQTAPRSSDIVPTKNILPPSRSVQNTPIADRPKGRVALIGTVPPDAILRQILPDIDAFNSPRFATAALIRRLVELEPMPAANLLAHMGYEAPLVATNHDPENCHREPVPFANLKKGLKANTAVAFGNGVHGAIDGSSLLGQIDLPPELAFKISFDENKRHIPTKGFLPDCGLFWSHDEVRHSLRCILMAGTENTLLRLKSPGDSAYIVAGMLESTTIHGDQTAAVHSDELGLVEFRIMALDKHASTPLLSTTLRKQLASTGLILEWSAI